MTNIDLDFDDKELLSYALAAHDKGLTLNQFFERGVVQLIIKHQNDRIAELEATNGDLQGQLDAALETLYPEEDD